jgi:hypothetical protein
MKSDDEKHSAHEAASPPPAFRLPGFINDHDVGLGDAIKRATSYIGIKPCGGCGRRAAALNQWFVFSGTRK